MFPSKATLISAVFIVFIVSFCSAHAKILKKDPAEIAPLFTLLPPIKQALIFKNELTEGLNTNIFIV